MGFIFFILLIVLFIGLFVVLSVFGFLRSILGLGRKTPRTNEQKQGFNRDDNKKSKVFEKDEGEYVDYEELED